MKHNTKEDITLEAGLLKFMSKRSNYERYIQYIDFKRLIPNTAMLLSDYKKYYETSTNDKIEWDEFYTEFNLKYHTNDLDHNDLEYYRNSVFPLIDGSNESGVLLSLLERSTIEDIKNSLENGIYIEDLYEKLENFRIQKSTMLGEKDEDIFTLSSLDLSVLDTSKGLEWFLNSIQANLNSIMPGQFIVVAADSDTGKSAFCISQAVHTFRQLNQTSSKRPILYFTSEDTKEDLACRFLSCLYCDKCVGGFEEVISNYKKIGAHYAANFDDSLFVAMPIRGPSDLTRIRQKIDLYNPSIIFIDLLDKLSQSDNIQDLTKLYQDIRGIANDGFPIIGTSQTGNTSYYDKENNVYKHRKWLTDKDLANSKSGKQGAAYSMIMIGKDDDIPNIRYITTTKKKRGKHCNVTCELDDVYSLYRELL